MAANNQPKLPALNEFTPNQLGGSTDEPAGATALYETLNIVKDGPDRDAVVERIRVRWFSDSADARADETERLEQQRKRAGNVIAGMRQAGLLKPSLRELEFTPLAEEILSFGDDTAMGLARFAKSLLEERRGLELLQIARSVRDRDGRVSKGAVDAELRLRGYAVPTNSSYSGKLRQWLAAAGVVDKDWVIDEDVLTSLTGVNSEQITEWRGLTSVQKAAIVCLRARWQGDQSALPSRDLLDLLRQQGVEFDAGQVKRDIYGPLLRGSWITQTLEQKGRGGKGGLISPTQKSLKVRVDLIERLRLGELPPDLQDKLATPLEEILADLDSTDTHSRGIALELLALRLASEAGLFPVELRQRGIATGGAEVDLVAEGAHLHFSRWLYQCKNTPTPVPLSVLAKEVGMATLLRAHVVVILTTGSFAQSVVSYARQASETTAIQIVLLDSKFLDKYRARGSSELREHFHARALDALSLKRHQLEEVPNEA